MEGVEMTGGGTHSVDAVDAPTASTLAGRPSRAPDYQVENRALVALAREMADNPSTVLQKVADLVMELCRAGSAGVSILYLDGSFMDLIDATLEWLAMLPPLARLAVMMGMSQRNRRGSDALSRPRRRAVRRDAASNASGASISSTDAA
jgi:hypothetical protein